MFNKSALSIFFSLIAFYLIGCNTIINSPQSTYDKFQEACDSDDLASAESLVTDNALLYSKNSGFNVCQNYMPDGFERIGISLGINKKPKWTAKDVQPEANVSGNTAYFTWKDPTVDFRDIQMTLYNADGEWKIENTIMLEH